MKVYIILMLTSYIFTGRKCLDCSKQDTDSRESAVIRLKKDLLCNYDSLSNPRKNYNSTVEVAATLRVKHIDYFHKWDVNTDEIQVIGWMTWNWTDEYLQWDSNKYSGIDYIILNSDIIWTPYVVHFTASDVETRFSELLDTKCTVFSTGSIICSFPVDYQALCIADLSNWPFDKHECTLMLSIYHSKKFDTNITKSAVSLAEYEQNYEWELISAFVKTALVPGYFLEYVFNIRRHATGYLSAILIPAVVLSLSTLLTFWIDSTSSNRIYLCCMNFFMYILYLEYLSYLLPSSGGKCPKIVYFFRDSMLLSVAATTIAVTLKNASSLQTPPPFWITSFFKQLQTIKIGQVILFPLFTSKETSINEESGEEAIIPVSISDWKIIGCLLDRLFFYLYMLIFFIFFVMFLL